MRSGEKWGGGGHSRIVAHTHTINSLSLCLSDMTHKNLGLCVALVVWVGFLDGVDRIDSLDSARVDR